MSFTTPACFGAFLIYVLWSLFFMHLLVNYLEIIIMTSEPVHTASREKWHCVPGYVNYHLKVKHPLHFSYVQPIAQHFESTTI